jgi:hypothetical protein
LTLPPWPSLPADATTTIFFDRAVSIADSREGSGFTAFDVSCEMLMTSALAWIA